MEYIVCFAIGAVTGAALFLGGFRAGSRTAIKEKPAADKDLTVRYRDTEQERAEKISKQLYNLMNYTGDPQDED